MVAVISQRYCPYQRVAGSCMKTIRGGNTRARAHAYLCRFVFRANICTVQKFTTSHKKPNSWVIAHREALALACPARYCISDISPSSVMPFCQFAEFCTNALIVSTKSLPRPRYEVCRLIIYLCWFIQNIDYYQMSLQEILSEPKNDKYNACVIQLQDKITQALNVNVSRNVKSVILRSIYNGMLL